MTNFRSLAGGYFSSQPTNKAWPVSIRMNNPGALNTAPWLHSWPGYIEATETTTGNKSCTFETPEQGVAAWCELLRKYRAAGATTVGQIIARYGGGQDYSAYVAEVSVWSGLPANHEIKLLGDDDTLLKFAKAMFRYEAGTSIPWSDAQILFGFALSRSMGTPIPAPALAPIPVTVPVPIQPEKVRSSWWKPIAEVFTGKDDSSQAELPMILSRILLKGMNGSDVTELQHRLITLGYTVSLSGTFDNVTGAAVRKFQSAHNLDPDGEVGEATLHALNAHDAHVDKPPLPAPSVVRAKPLWYVEADKWIGWKERGVNLGIEKFIAGAGVGSLGDPWCAIFVNYCLETNHIHGSGSALARSFERSQNFVKLAGPALGAITTMWRGSVASGQGHVFLYDGENSKGVRGIGANELDMVKRSIHLRNRIIGYYWPKSVALPIVGAITVGNAGDVASSET